MLLYNIAVEERVYGYHCHRLILSVSVDVQIIAFLDVLPFERCSLVVHHHKWLDFAYIPVVLE